MFVFPGMNPWAILCRRRWRLTEVGKSFDRIRRIEETMGSHAARVVGQMPMLRLAKHKAFEGRIAACRSEWARVRWFCVGRADGKTR